jgi:hypothetical protein
MRFLFFPALFLSFITSCTPEEPRILDKTTNNKVNKESLYNRLEGVYEGDFGGTGNIRIVLQQVTGTQASGYNEHKGLRRIINGDMNADGGSFTFHLLEPGDNTYDGEFKFKIDTQTFKLTGTWQPANNDQLTEKEFVLSRTGAAYNVESMMRIMYDSLGAEYHFEDSGLVRYRYYPDDRNQEVTTQQYEEIKGSWKKTPTEYIIDWPENAKLPATHLVLKIMPYPGEREGYYLEGKGLKIEPLLPG